MAQTRSFTRRESIMVIPGLDNVLDGYGRLVAPADRREYKVTVRVLTRKYGHDYEFDRLLAQLAGPPQRLVYKTDAGGLRITVGHFLSAEVIATVDQGYYQDVVLTWRIRPSWRTRFSASADIFSSDDGVFADGTIVPFETFSAPNTFNLDAATKSFTLANSGTLGNDLPTLPDTGPRILVVGPYGGANGFTIASTNSNVQVRGPDGQYWPLQFTVPFPLVDGHDSVSIDFSTMTFVHGSVAFRPTRASFQREWMKVMPANNAITYAPLGGSVLYGSGAYTAWDWDRSFV